MNLLFLVALIPLLVLAPTLSFAQFNLKLPGLDTNSPIQVPPMGQQPGYTIQPNASVTSLLPKSLTDSILNQAKMAQSQMRKSVNATGPEYTDTTSIQNITARVNAELKNGTISSNGTILVIYAYYSIGAVSWQGSIDTNGNSGTQDGSGRAVIPISCGSTMSFQKQEEPGYLALAVIHNGVITNIQLTTSSYGVVTATSGCT
jgi:hypothetical protein